jgi:hypothetical protein
VLERRERKREPDPSGRGQRAGLESPWQALWAVQGTREVACEARQGPGATGQARVCPDTAKERGGCA